MPYKAGYEGATVLLIKFAVWQAWHKRPIITFELTHAFEPLHSSKQYNQ
jgi:hypothetical protein